MTIPRRNADDVIELLEVTKGGGDMATMPMAIKHMVNVYRFSEEILIPPDGIRHVLFELGMADASLVHLDIFCIDEAIKFNVVEISASSGRVLQPKALAVDMAKNTEPSKTVIATATGVTVKSDGKHPNMDAYNSTGNLTRTRIFDCADMDCFRMAAHKMYSLTLFNLGSRHVTANLDGVLVEETMKMPSP